MSNANNIYVVTDYGVNGDSGELQTKALQSVFDMCKEKGGMVVIPKGTFYTGGLYMHSDTTLYLCEGAHLVGSDDCNDYEVFPFPEGLPVRSDMELITQYYGKPWDTYRRAIISSYGERNISIIGEKESYIDGQNCYDPCGEERYRGPHAIYVTCCENVRFEGYTAQHSGNFLHEANNCRGILMRHVTCLGGSDGIHLHCSKDVLIEECLFKTGDDCIAGINIQDMTVRRCVMNSSCNLFRMGGVDITVEDCHAYGPGYYPHRKTIVRGKNDYLPREAGRHDMLCMIDYFASTNYPYEPSKNITFINCLFENFKSVIRYRADVGPLQSGTHFTELTLENVCFTGLREASVIEADEKEPLTVKLNNVTASFHESAEEKALFSERSVNLKVIGS